MVVTKDDLGNGMSGMGENGEGRDIARSPDCEIAKLLVGKDGNVPFGNVSLRLSMKSATFFPI
jgi:hypothetical protein